METKNIELDSVVFQDIAPIEAKTESHTQSQTESQIEAESFCYFQFLCSPLAQKVWIRLLIRALFIGFIIGMSFVFSYKSIADAYLNWIDQFGIVKSYFLFLGMAIVFSSISPTGYFPTVAAGATFFYPIAWSISYISVNFAAILNLVYVRYWCVWISSFFINCFQNRLKIFEISKLNELLESENPIRIVAFFRFPFLGSGLLNYIFSLCSISPINYILGNLIGFIPGSLLFSLLGHSARSLFDIIFTGNISSDPLGLSIFIIEILVVFSSLIFLYYYWKRAQARIQTELNEDQTEQPTAI